MPAWVWVLLLVLLAAIVAAVLFFSGDEDDGNERDAADTTAVEARRYDETAAPITSVALLLGDGPGSAEADTSGNADRSRNLDGRRVALRSVRVADVVGDSAIYVADTADMDRRVLVVPAEQQGGAPEPPQAGSDANGVLGVAEGDTVSVEGTAHRYAEAEHTRIPEAARSDLRDGAIYVAADPASIRPAGGDAPMTPSTRTDTTTMR